MSSHFLILGLVLCLSACGSSPKTNFYVLNAEYEMPERGLEGTGVGVWKVKLPALLDRSEIVTREGPHKIELGDFHRWAGDFGSNINALIAHELSQRLKTVRVSTSPWSAHKINDYQVKVYFDRFDGELGGKVVCRGVWLLLNGKGDKELTRESFTLDDQVNGKKYSDMVATMSGLVVQLSDQIADAIIIDEK
jgi:uncharacterized lipoprotein YmbA